MKEFAKLKNKKTDCRPTMWQTVNSNKDSIQKHLCALQSTRKHPESVASQLSSVIIREPTNWDKLVPT